MSLNAIPGRIPTSTFANGSCHIIPAFGNVSVFETEEGLIIFDAPIKPLAPLALQKLRDLTDKQVKYIIFSHGHIDHSLLLICTIIFTPF